MIQQTGIRHGRPYCGPVEATKHDYYRCSLCKECKHKTEFFSDASRYNGLHSRCKECHGSVAKMATRLKRQDSKQPGQSSYAAQLIKDKNYSEINRIMAILLTKRGGRRTLSHEHECTLCLKTKPAGEFSNKKSVVCGKMSQMQSLL